MEIKNANPGLFILISLLIATQMRLPSFAQISLQSWWENKGVAPCY